MAFTLRITFSGLCLFVPEAAESGATEGRMHVLMPRMFCGPDRHVAAVAYDTGHLAEGGTPTGATAMISISGQQVVPVAGETAALALCSHIVDLREITQRPVDPDALGADTSAGSGGPASFAPSRIRWSGRSRMWRATASRSSPNPSLEAESRSRWARSTP